MVGDGTRLRQAYEASDAQRWGELDVVKGEFEAMRQLVEAKVHEWDATRQEQHNRNRALQRELEVRRSLGGLQRRRDA